MSWGHPGKHVLNTCVYKTQNKIDVCVLWSREHHYLLWFLPYFCSDFLETMISINQIHRSFILLYVITRYNRSLTIEINRSKKTLCVIVHTSKLKCRNSFTNVDGVFLLSKRKRSSPGIGKHTVLSRHVDKTPPSLAHVSCEHTRLLLDKICSQDTLTRHLHVKRPCRQETYSKIITCKNFPR